MNAPIARMVDAEPACKQPTATELRGLLIEGAKEFNAKYPVETPQEAVDRFLAEGKLGGGASTCEHCDIQFEPRERSGGKPQRFCSPECRTAFHSENRKAPPDLKPQRDQRAPTCSALPVPIDPPEPKPVFGPTGDDFDWSEDPAIVLCEQASIAIYENQAGGVTIRQQRGWDQEDDIIVFIARQNIPAFIDRLVALAGVPSAGR